MDTRLICALLLPVGQDLSAGPSSGPVNVLGVMPFEPGRFMLVRVHAMDLDTLQRFQASLEQGEGAALFQRSVAQPDLSFSRECLEPYNRALQFIYCLTSMIIFLGIFIMASRRAEHF